MVDDYCSYYGFAQGNGNATAVAKVCRTDRMERDARPDFGAIWQKHVPETNLLDFMTGEGGTYNLCHFWSNFEIADLSFFRSEAYTAYLNFLDRSGASSMHPVICLLTCGKLCKLGPTFGTQRVH